MSTDTMTDRIHGLIRIIRNQRVVLDFDLAQLYAAETRVFNQAVRRNLDRFPSDFAFQLTPEESAGLKSEPMIGSSHSFVKQPDTMNSSHSVMSSRKHRGASYLPWAFTEHGALMAANILRSTRAVEMSVFVIRAFVKMREAHASNAAVLKRLAKIDQTLLVHDSALRDLYQKLLPLLSPPPETPRPKIGFHPGSH